MNRYMLIDGNNIAHAASSTKKLTVGDQEVQGIFIFIKMLRKLVAKYPMCKPIVLWDGASWRNMKFPDYKDNREAATTPAEQKAQADRQSAKKQIPAIRKGLQLLGIHQIKATNMEADDLAAIVGDRYVNQGGRVILVSGDRDWVQLVGPHMSWFDPINDRKIAKVEDLECIKVKLNSLDQFVEFKALYGDKGDNISGVGGIGDKGAMEFMQLYGSVAAFTNMILDGSLDPATVPAKFRALAESEEKQLLFRRNIMLMDLRTRQRPLPVNLQVDAGEPDLARFEKFARMLQFQSFLTDLAVWASIFPAFRLEEAA